MSRTLKLLAVVLLFVLPNAFGQDITGRLFPEKSDYVVGEPIVIILEATNERLHTEIVSQNNCDSAEFRVTNAEVAPDLHGSKCIVFGDGGSSCGSDIKHVAARGEFEDRLLLHGPGHSHFDLSQPGVYHVEASDRVLIVPATSGRLMRTAIIQSDFDIEIRQPYEGELKTRFQRFVDDLGNSDYSSREVAIAALVQNPPHFLENVILSMSDSPNPELRFDSIEGLARLNTSAAHAKLLEMSSRRDANLAQEAIFTLGRVADPDDCTRMLEIASGEKHSAAVGAYVAGARICRSRAVPTLIAALSGADEDLAEGIATALADTGSREAVPPLISLLGSSDRWVRMQADAALFTLTYRIRQNVSTPEAATQVQSDWRSWWFMNSESAQIYGPDQCPASSPR